MDKRPQPLARDAMAYVLAGGRGSRLAELTDVRAKPAVYFGGKTRIIDFALSNALNSGIRRIGGAFADPSFAARLELLPHGAKREL
jgi:glucose-1-phosphate adenylyltransferase